MSRPSWYIDEFAHAGEEHLDPEYVAAYDRKSQTDPSDDLALLQEMGMNEQSVLVDLGAGTGVFALAAAPHCGRVVAVDVSPPMLDYVRREADALGLTNVEVVQGGLLSYEHQGEPADFVYTRNVLHHLPDFWKGIALQRIADMLRPNGVLRLHDLVYTFEPDEVEQFFDPWLTNAAASPDVGWTREEYETHIRTEYSTYSWLLEAIIERVGFEIDDVSHSPSGIYSAYTCVKRTE
jgi:SAM-dependent methyltransferase